MAYLFPIGTISAASSTGTIDSISYSLFEPNNGCISMPNYNVLVSEYANKTLFTRKKSLPFIGLTYTYENIWTKEYNQIRHFIEEMDDALTPFYVVDWSKGQDPSAISGGAWSTDNVVSIDDTKLYSVTTGYKSNYMLFWNGALWKMGSVSSITTNTSVTVNVSGSNYGSLTYANAVSRGYVYPIYTCYMEPGSISNFTKGDYIDRPVSLTGIGGYMYSGSINFRGKYKI